MSTSARSPATVKGDARSRSWTVSKDVTLFAALWYHQLFILRQSKRETHAEALTLVCRARDIALRALVVRRAAIVAVLASKKLNSAERKSTNAPQPRLTRAGRRLMTQVTT